MRTLASLIVTLMIFVTFEVSAQTVRFGPRGDTAAMHRVATMVSNEGEDKVEFLGRVGRLMTNYTTQNNVEVCAQICRNPANDRIGVITNTNNSLIACLVVDMCPEGMVSTNEGIHSHPNDGRYKLSRIDMNFLRARNDSNKDREITIRNKGAFSHFDRAAGSGYLVERGMLIYFDGDKNTTLGPVSEKAFPEYN